MFTCSTPTSNFSNDQSLKYQFFSYSVPRVSRLLKCGVSPNACDGAATDNKVLHWVASYGTEEMVRLLCGKETYCQIVHVCSRHAWLAENKLYIVSI
jgi:hypothetical protein